MADTKTVEALPPLPEPFDYCYVWNGPYGKRKLGNAAHHNGRPCDEAVLVYTQDQMRAYATAAIAALTARAEAAEARVQELLGVAAARPGYPLRPAAFASIPNATNRHTPGPWDVSFEHPRFVIQARAEDGPGKVGIAVTAGLWDNAHNARLIAAAPDMIEALKHINQFDAARLGAIGSAMVRAAIVKASRDTP